MLSSFSSMDQDANYRVLILDPNIEEGKNSASLIQSEGHDIQIVQNGNHAINLLDAQIFDVVFCEIFFPDQDGFALCKSLWQYIQSQSLKLPMMALTHTNNPEHVRLCFKSGMMNFILKPLTPTKLHAAMTLLNYKQKKYAYPAQSLQMRELKA